MAERRYFGTIDEVIEPPNLIEVQSKSYEDFLQKDVPATQRIETGLQAVLQEVFPIKSYDETIELDFNAYDIEDPKATALEACASTRRRRPTALKACAATLLGACSRPGDARVRGGRWPHARRTSAPRAR